MRCRHRGITKRELLVVMVIILTLMGLLTPTFLRVREKSNRIKCAENLRQIGQAILLYSNDNRGLFPATVYFRAESVIPTWGTGATSPDPFWLGGPAPNDVTAALFLLLRTQDIGPDKFVCPAASQRPWDFGGGGRTALGWSNWTDVKGQLSYSYQNPYWDNATASRIPHGISRSMNVDYAVAADLNPGGDVLLKLTTSAPTDEQRLANSQNHGGHGQNVLYIDGRVVFQSTAFAGIDHDNIYTARLSRMATSNGGGLLIASPYDDEDSVLLPTAE